MSTHDKISKVATVELLKAVPLPKKTASYSPVPHKKVVDLTLEALDKANIKVERQFYTLARDGRQANGVLMLKGGDKEMHLRLQWQNSYDKSLPLALGFGTHVIVCDNGMVMGDLGRFKRKHTGTVLDEFEESIVTSIGTAGETFKRLSLDRERMKEIEITKRTTAELIGRMHIEEDLLTATQVGIIKKELETPTYNYKADGTLWQLYNHCTFSLKEAHPQFNLEQHMNLHNFFTKEFKLA